MNSWAARTPGPRGMFFPKLPVRAVSEAEGIFDCNFLCICARDQVFVEWTESQSFSILLGTAAEPREAPAKATLCLER